MEVKLLCVALICLIGFCSASSTWDYEKHGPEHTWKSNFPHCDGKKQSPINIKTSIAVTNHSLGIAHRSLFAKRPKTMLIEDNGHTLVVGHFEGAYEISDPKILPFIAVLDQYHFHWAYSAHGTGSEHLLDGRQYFGEMHAVHYNKKYGSIEEAADKLDGLAVFAWFIDTKYPQTNLDFANLLDFATHGAREEGGKVHIHPTFSLETLLPPNLDVYYRYSGSLTTPPCYESVTWTVFKEPIQIHINQAAILTSMFYENRAGTIPLRHNFRPVEKLNGRIITQPPTCV